VSRAGLGQYDGPAVKQQHLQVTRIVAGTAVDDGVDAVLAFPYFAANLHFAPAYAQHETGLRLVEMECIACGVIQKRHGVFSGSETLNMTIMYHKHCMNKQYFIFLLAKYNKGA
jgi:hypothetical protein